MIISRTPYRISFFGGGTDYPAWYVERGGCVLSTTIDKYLYITCRHLPPFFEHRSRIVYSDVELVYDNEDIRHPSVRESLKFLGIKTGLQIHYDGDLPARTGVGSSSSFTVGLLNALRAFQGVMLSKMELAQDAIHVEQDLIGEHVGSQDQMAAAFGGFNRIDFNIGGSVAVHPIVLPNGRLEELQEHLLMVFTGIVRTADRVAAKQLESMPRKEKQLEAMRGFVDEAVRVLGGSGSIDGFGELLHENWLLKRQLADEVSTPIVDMLYQAARSAGALGGKLLGAGGGGFLLLFVRPQDRQAVMKRLQVMMFVPCSFENSGSQIVLYQPDDAPIYGVPSFAEIAPLTDPGREGLLASGVGRRGSAA